MALVFLIITILAEVKMGVINVIEENGATQTLQAETGQTIMDIFTADEMDAPMQPASQCAKLTVP